MRAGARLEAGTRSAERAAAFWCAHPPGRGPRAGEAVAVGAHYDHLGIGPPVNGDSIYNGAEDNASGVACMLAAAEAVAGSGVRPARTIVFAAFAAEELGLQGSEWLVRHPPAGLRLVGAFAMDVLNLYGKTRDIGTVGVNQSSLGELVRRAAAAEKMTINEDLDDLRRGRFFRSDNYAFARENIPAMRIVNGVDFVGRPPDWGRKQRELGEKRRAVEQTRIGVLEAEAQVAVEVRRLLRNLQDAQSLVPVKQLAQEAATDNLRVTMNRYTQKAALLQEVLQAQSALADANHQYQQAVQGVMTAKADFEKAIGEE